MREALDSRHMGQVIRAYRKHRHHGRYAISQATVAAWGCLTQTQLSRIENGQPIMHLDRLVHWAKTLKIPGHLLWFNLPDQDTPEPDKASGIRRSDFLKVGGLAVAGAATGGALLPGLTGGPLTEQDCAQWLAWELWHSKRTSLHESEMPAPVASFLRSQSTGMVPGMGMILRDAEGSYSFAHPSFIDFFVARRVFDNIASGGGALFATAQTSHQMDLIICEFVSRDTNSAKSLHEWMRKASSPVLRVNSAGVLAKMGPTGSDTDQVVAALKRDDDARQLYLTAVTSRVLGMPWGEASQFAATLENSTAQSLAAQMSREQATLAASKLGGEVQNPRDGGARWCSSVILGHLEPVAPEATSTALNQALRTEPNPEILRSLGAILAGNNPTAF